MPDTTSRFDDPFADLFGKLPDPRHRGGDAPGPRRTPAPLGDEFPAHHDAHPPAPEPAPIAASTPAMTPVAAAVPVTPPASPPAPEPTGTDAAAAGAVPSSRRAAREARKAPAPAAAPAQPAEPATNVPAAPVLPATAIMPVSPAAAQSEEPAAPAHQEPTGPSTPEPQPATAPFAFDDLFAARATEPEDAPAANVRTGTGAQGVVAPAGDNLQDLFMGRASSDQIGQPPPPPNRRRRRIGGWIALGIVLLLLGGIAAGGLYVWTTYEGQIREFMGWEEPKDYEDGLANGEALVTISSGDTGGVISQSLYDAGVTKEPSAFYDMLVDTGQNPTFYPGVYKLQKQMTSAAALTALQDPANKLENSALLREGLTVEQTLPILAEGIGLPLEDFQAAVADPSVYGITVDPAIAAASGQPLEGWLFPAMYTFDPGATATDVIQTMVNRTIQSLDAAGVPLEDRQRILTTASIIQREASFEDDMQKVSRVIQNRLDSANDQTFGLLQMDSTAQYGYGEMHDGTVSSSQAALDDPNPWNTYVHAGLPIGPIANPGDVAIDAAMHPVDGPWFYFVTVNPDSGETVFTETVQEHEKYVKQWQDWCAANPGRC
ncbi:endolytic transglycosylase MltG [Microbacterium sp. SS28]|uniref:endolytic transglycosylase MltG n=1 Tax=Microbacterium sp. SS28 TaxID=2919948 RepID=UPI001FA95BD5|nr:endolytic transglycosylase MltG [Microbacterium sp. SS28]